MLSTFLQTTAETIEAVPVQEELSFSLISMAAKGGWLMLVLLALSIIAMTVYTASAFRKIRHPEATADH